MLAVDDVVSVCEPLPVAVVQLDTDGSTVLLSAPLLVVDVDMLTAGDGDTDTLFIDEFETRGEPDAEKVTFALIDGRTEGEGGCVDRGDPVDEPAHDGDLPEDSLGVVLDDARGEPETEFVEPVGEVDADVDELADAAFDADLCGESVAFRVGADWIVMVDVNVTAIAVDDGYGDSLPRSVAVSDATSERDGVDERVSSKTLGV